MLERMDGFTLFEMLMVLVILAIITQSALVGLPELKRSMERNAARQQVEFDLQRARNEALAAGSRAIFTVSATGTSYTVGIDEYPFSSTGVPDSTLFSKELPTNITLSTSALVIFNSGGYVVDTAGNVASSTVSLSDDEGDILTATLYPIGSLEYQ
ncbi:MAG: prepilin-type N-terminal cleavage/methylation domain-containing protein [Bdellovibrionota bacterium]